MDLKWFADDKAELTKLKLFYLNIMYKLMIVKNLLSH
jgi:hypothetical protein